MCFSFSRDTMGSKNKSVMLSDNDFKEYNCFENINIEEDGHKSVDPSYAIFIAELKKDHS
jgi:hypothetical protein